MRKKLTRRNFIETAAVGFAGAAVSIGTPDTLAEIPGLNAGIRKSKTGMNYRRLGRTNLMISEMILGCASGLRSQQLGPILFNRYREQLPNIVSELLDRGGNAVATSSSYHDTEELLGKALIGRRQKAFIFTSAPPLEDAKSVIASCERSLIRFQTDHIDGYFCHGGWSAPFYEGAKKLQEQGKINFIGQSAHKPENHVVRIEANEVDFIFQPYNYMNLAKWTEKLDGRSAEDLFELCKMKDVGVLAIKPFSGHFIPNWAKNSTDPMVQDLLDDLKKFGKKNLYQALLLWVLQNPNINAAICGFNEPQDVVEDYEGYLGGKLTAFHEDLLKRYYTLGHQRLLPSVRNLCALLSQRYPHSGHSAYSNVLSKTMAISSMPANTMLLSILSKHATSCDGCGACEAACPSGVSIIKNMEDAHKLLA